jgi:hypothetical protein
LKESWARAIPEPQSTWIVYERACYSLIQSLEISTWGVDWNRGAVDIARVNLLFSYARMFISYSFIL